MKLTAYETKHLNRISAFLHAISDRMIEDIKEIMNGDYGLYETYSKEHIKFYDFKLFGDYKINFLPMGNHDFQLGFKETLTEYPKGFMSQKNLYLDESIYNFDDNDLAVINEFYLQTEKRIIEWFNECWIKAGGLDLSDHYRISVSDEKDFFDLKSQNWVKQEES